MNTNGIRKGRDFTTVEHTVTAPSTKNGLVRDLTIANILAKQEQNTIATRHADSIATITMTWLLTFLYVAIFIADYKENRVGGLVAVVVALIIISHVRTIKLYRVAFAGRDTLASIESKYHKQVNAVDQKVIRGLSACYGLSNTVLELLDHHTSTNLLRPKDALYVRAITEVAIVLAQASQQIEAFKTLNTDSTPEDAQAFVDRVGVFKPVDLRALSALETCLRHELD